MVKSATAPVLASLLTILSMLVPSHALAVECYTPSPNLSSLGDDYYALDKPNTLSDEDNNKINALFRAMSGNWKGDMQYLECRGPDSAPRIISRTASISAKTRLSSAIGLEINAEKHDIEHRSKRPEHFALIGNKPVFDLMFDGDHYVVFAERNRRLNQIGKKEDVTKKSSDQSTTKVKQKTSRITETIVEIKMNSALLYLTRRYYTNGVYIGEERWQLQRD